MSRYSEVSRIKTMVRDRDGNRCTKCGFTSAQHYELHGRNLEVHRLTPGSLYTVDGCVTLCKTCHAPEPRRPRGTKDLEQPARMVRVRLPLIEPGEILAERLATDFTEIVNLAVREYLERNGMWPYSRKPASDS